MIDDDELNGLLDELDDIDDDEISADIQSQEIVETLESEDPLDKLEDIADDSGFVMRPVDVRKMDNLTSTEELEIDEFSQPISTSSVDIDKYKTQLDIVTEEVLAACRSDRQEAQDVINDLRTRLQQGPAGPPSKSLVDGIVKAVEVKSNINQNAIRMMDTNAKFLASIKPSGNTNNVLNNYTSSDELDRILNGSPVDSD